MMMIILSIVVIILVYFLPKNIIKCLNKWNDRIFFFTNNDKICITIDDAPYGESFISILDILEHHNIHVTFFIISSFVNENNKHLLLRAIKDGHQLANHGKTDSMHVLMTYNQIKDEIEDCQNLI